VNLDVTNILAHRAVCLFLTGHYDAAQARDMINNVRDADAIEGRERIRRALHQSWALFADARRVKKAPPRSGGIRGLTKLAGREPPARKLRSRLLEVRRRLS
jgi:hypothetical protein